MAASDQSDKDKEAHHVKCHDCGVFIKKELWVPKSHPWKKHALCWSCLSNYDDPHCA